MNAFRAQAEHDVSAFGHHQRDFRFVDLQRTIAGTAIEQVDGRRADEACDEQRGGALVEVFGRPLLLDPSGGDLDDPYGCDQETYRRTAQKIESMLDQRLNELGL